ncbi:hypothetical protein [Xanthomonas vasicola]|uniref:hypothetical protein n=1 Tax=Xanthomonas vasicola TaxID=56459 RepID=UPI001D0C703D|nr:hypothetical protein [Xanthomonas vasicola]
MISPLNKGSDMNCDWIGWCALSASEQAAWVQAVGSVAAILAAIGIAAHERHVAKAETVERKRLESNARYTRANRAMTRFRKVIARQLEAAKTQQNPMPADPLPDEMRDLEHECHLIPQVGGDCLTAINFYEDARGLLEGSFLPTENTERFIELLKYADSRIEIALEHFYKYLDTARH